MNRTDSGQTVVIAGLGNATGTGAACARLFSKQLGYKVALVSRPRKEVTELKEDIEKCGGCAGVFSVDSYDHDSFTEAFNKIDETWPNAHLACAIWNAVEFSLAPFLDITPDQIERSVQVNVVAATAFAQLAVRRFLRPSPATDGKAFHKGSLLITGGQAALSGKEGSAALSAGRFGLRALSQSVAHEFGPQGVHVALVVISGTISTDRTKAALGDKFGPGWMEDEARRLSPESVAKTFLFLHQQAADAWTLELDLRPAKEKF